MVIANLLSWAVLTLAATFPLAAQPIEGFHIFEGLVGAGHGLLLTPQLRLRTADRFRELAQVRAGVIATQGVRKNLDVVAAGYYEPTLRGPRFLASYRVQLGGQARFAMGPKLSVQPRLLWERLNRTTGLAYRRVRMGGRLIWNGTFRGRPVSPYLYNDTFVTGANSAAGLFHSSRSGGGIAWAVNDRTRLEFEYFYDVRRDVWGGNRQVVTTRVQFH